MIPPGVVIVAFTFAIAFAPLAAPGQQAARIPRIGVLSSAIGPTVHALRQGLLDAGYVDGQNIQIEYRSAEKDLDRLPALAADLVRLKVDVIVAIGGLATRTAKNATATIPIVMAPVGDPVGLGFVKNLARSGGNITGVSVMSREFGGKRMELIKEAMPRASRIAILAHPNTLDLEGFLKKEESAARTLGLSLQLVKARDAKELDKAFAEMLRWRANAVSVLPSPVLNNQRELISTLAMKNRLPSICESREFVEAGCLMSYGSSLTDGARRSAVYIQKILNGAKPADLPVEQSATFELAINLKTAKMIGLSIPQSLLARADQVIQ